MQSYFVNDFSPDYYNEKIIDAADYLKVDPKDVVSIKIRPLKEVDNSLMNAYTSGWEYEAFDKYLEKNLSFKKIRVTHNNKAIVTAKGDRILYTKHESGVEFIIAAALASMDLVTTVGNFVFFFIEHYFKDKSKGKEHIANSYKVISIEKRKKGKKVKIVKVIEMNNTDLTKDDIKKIIEDSLKK